MPLIFLDITRRHQSKDQVATALATILAKAHPATPATADGDLAWRMVNGASNTNPDDRSARTVFQTQASTNLALAGWGSQGSSRGRHGSPHSHGRPSGADTKQNITGWHQTLHRKRCPAGTSHRDTGIRSVDRSDDHRS